MEANVNTSYTSAKRSNSGSSLRRFRTDCRCCHLFAMDLSHDRWNDATPIGGRPSRMGLVEPDALGIFLWTGSFRGTRLRRTCSRCRRGRLCDAARALDVARNALVHPCYGWRARRGSVSPVHGNEGGTTPSSRGGGPNSRLVRRVGDARSQGGSFGCLLKPSPGRNQRSDRPATSTATMAVIG